MKTIFSLFIFLVSASPLQGLDSWISETRINGERVLCSVREDEHGFHAVIVDGTPVSRKISPITVKGNDITIKIDGKDFVLRRPGVYVVMKKFGKDRLLMLEDADDIRKALKR